MCRTARQMSANWSGDAGSNARRDAKCALRFMSFSGVYFLLSESAPDVFPYIEAYRKSGIIAALIPTLFPRTGGVMISVLRYKSDLTHLLLQEGTFSFSFFFFLFFLWRWKHSGKALNKDLASVYSKWATWLYRDSHVASLSLGEGSAPSHKPPGWFFLFLFFLKAQNMTIWLKATRKTYNYHSAGVHLKMADPRMA